MKSTTILLIFSLGAVCPVLVSDVEYRHHLTNRDSTMVPVPGAIDRVGPRAARIAPPVAVLSSALQMRAHKCGHCGADNLEWKTDTEVVCLHCRTRYRKVPRAEPRVVIKKGANVVFGPTAKVTIRGGLEIEEGANVRVEGDLEFELEVVELGDGVRDEG